MKISVKNFLFQVIFILGELAGVIMGQALPLKTDFNALNGTHDLTFPDWGPYSKRYIGISHIPAKESGIRFDLSVFPGFYRRKVAVPDVLFESDYHPWEASPNLEYFSFRHELEWKDQVYTDISYSEIDPKARLIKVDLVNNTENNENLALHFMASVNFPPIKEYSIYTYLYPGIVTLPGNVKWVSALDYTDLKFAKTRPTDNLVADGKMRAEIRADGFVNGNGIGEGFGADKGDFASYKLNVPQIIDDAVLFIRYKLENGKEAKFTFKGIYNNQVILKGKDEFGTEIVPLGKVEKGDAALTIVSEGTSAIELDGFAVAPKDKAGEIKIEQKKWNMVPQIINGPVGNSLILKYDDVDTYYGLLWQFDLYEVRQWFDRNLSNYFKQMVNEHVLKIFPGEQNGHFTNVFLKPIELGPKSSKTIYAVVCCGTKEEVIKRLAEMNSSADKYPGIYEAAKKKMVKIDVNPDGEKYKFSVEKMQTVLTTNVVYPVYTQRQYIRHSAPGRWWDCLYTWDSGFIGLGMLQTSAERAIESLNAYVQEPGAQSAFIHHGSPVPVQQYLFQELWNKTQSKEMLEYFYPRMKQYHEFMAGRLGSSTTRVLKSNILKTWDYFYNSGGWDDYPPQKYTHDNLLEETIAPVITTSQAIRTAKILKLAAAYLGRKDDIKEYDDDIKTFTDALQKYSWDEKSGYFGYVVHDKDGNPLNILKYENKVNYNMGFDGAYPLVAGVCTESQKEKLVAAIESPEKIWSNAGLSAVDQSAPYYRVDGYWNGTVWMSHQWFFWKTMLDIGEGDFAFSIAKRALDVWKTEVEATYNCMEHFLIGTGRGAGWHEFGGLSSPVLYWYKTYFSPGSFEAGFDEWIENRKFENDNTKFSVDLTFKENSNKKTSVVACMNPQFEYDVKWNNKSIAFKTFGKGMLNISIPVEGNRKGRLEIEKKK